MSDSRVPLLVVSDAVAATGFARVAHCILERLRDRYEIHHLGINYGGDPHDADWKIYPATLGGDIFGVGRLDGLIEKIKPRLVFMIYDVWVLARFASIVERHRDTLRSVMYFPVDGVPVEPASIKPLQAIDRWVAYTEFGAAAMREACTVAAREDAEIAARDIAIIPHGVERKYFHPLPGGRREARQALLPDATSFHDSLIVLNANRNQPRKRIDVTMEGFALFARDKPPNVRLYLHMGREDAGWDVVLLAKRFGIEERMILTSLDSGVPHETPERLNLIYNACDIGLNTASGEGWGLAAFEHAATGAAQILPRHTACAELWEGAAEFVDPVVTLINEKVLTSAHIVAPKDVAAALERLYRDPARRAALADAALRNATQPRYDWDVIARRWDEIFSSLLAQ